MDLYSDCNCRLRCCRSHCDFGGRFESTPERARRAGSTGWRGLCDVNSILWIRRLGRKGPQAKPFGQTDRNREYSFALVVSIRTPYWPDLSPTGLRGHRERWRWRRRWNRLKTSSRRSDDGRSVQTVEVLEGGRGA